MRKFSNDDSSLESSSSSSTVDISALWLHRGTKSDGIVRRAGPILVSTSSVTIPVVGRFPGIFPPQTKNRKHVENAISIGIVLMNSIAQSLVVVVIIFDDVAATAAAAGGGRCGGGGVGAAGALPMAS